jgi:hypothetical protein
MPRSPDTASHLGWSGAGPALACNGSADLLPLRHAAFLANQQARLPPSFTSFRSFGCIRPVRRLSTAIEAASGGFEQLSGD